MGGVVVYPRLNRQGGCALWVGILPGFEFAILKIDGRLERFEVGNGAIPLTGWVAAISESVAMDGVGATLQDFLGGDG